MNKTLNGIAAVSLALGLSFAGYSLYRNTNMDRKMAESPQPNTAGYTMTGYSLEGGSSRTFPQSQQPQPMQPSQYGSGSNSIQVNSLPANTQGSSNWAGYVTEPTSDQRYTSITGSWTVPKVTGNQNSLAAQWIGLGGVSSQDLLQMGTIEQFDNGTEEAQIFWEQLPENAQNIMTGPVGTKIDASIEKASGSVWDIHFTAHTPSGQTLSKTISVTLSDTYAEEIGTSADWISEDPSDENGHLYPLANAGKVAFSSATVDHEALNASGNQLEPMAMVSSDGSVLIAPSNLGTGGESFSTDTLSTDNGSSSGIPEQVSQNSGYGWGSGYGEGYGEGYGQGYGSGFGQGYGSGFGQGYGSGYGQGYNYRYGESNGYGQNHGYGRGYVVWVQMQSPE